MKELLNQLYSTGALSYAQATEACRLILAAETPPVQIAALLSAINMRPIQGDELRAFRDGLLQSARIVKLSDQPFLDLCGTGGDGKNSFNISTISAFVVSAAGYPVAKHGNNSASSVYGSSQLIEALGLKLKSEETFLRADFTERGLCFLHAPLFHPALKSVAQLRRDMGVRTIFNLLGPLLNPARPTHQVCGVLSPEVARLYAQVFNASSVEFRVVHSLDGYDEISLTSDVLLITPQGESRLKVEDFGLSKLDPRELHAPHTVEAGARLAATILSGKGTPGQTQVVAANAGLAIECIDRSYDLKRAVARAKDVILSGAAIEKLEQCRRAVQ